MRKFTGTATLLFLLAAAAPALGQSGFPKELAGMLGEWSLEGEDASVYQCTIKLRSDPVIGGYGVDVPKSCKAPAPRIAAWYIAADGSVVLLDAGRKPVLKLAEQGDAGLFGTDAKAGPQFFLVQPGLGD